MAAASTVELNQSLRFDQLSSEERGSFTVRPTPIHIRLEKGTQLYKWTQYGLFNPHTGIASSFWSPWAAMTIGGMNVPGFSDLRKRYRNINGGVGRPQEFMRVRSAVTDYWNTMSSITKAELVTPVWGFLGVCGPKPPTKHDEQLHNMSAQDRAKIPPTADVLFIGGAYQLVLPNMDAQHIFKL
ncbi:hypothetical protein [Granulicella arctica]|uniref:hypothetical protein n=1 Tax=Granulicella arctica TaxID=940613 RepID=UPI0021E05C02|nr:hypothetical protein [Granulicella arctica]